MSEILSIAKNAKKASQKMRSLQTQDKNKALDAIANKLEQYKEKIIEENKKDIQNAITKGQTNALIERLRISEATVENMIISCHHICALADPIGEVNDSHYLPSGIQVGQMRTPIGVIAMIYESRPNVTIDASALCIKSANAVILRGGSEAIYSNRALYACIKEALASVRFPEHSVQLIMDTDRALIDQLLTLPDYIDVIIPRGGKGLIQRVMDKASVPVIKHLDGICHVYIDEFASEDKAMAIAINAKTQRYGVCNAMETLLIHENIASKILPKLAELFHQKEVQIRGCDISIKLIKSVPVILADEVDWQTEYLAPIVSIKVMESFDKALEHIHTYSSAHTDAIVTESYSRSRAFIQQVDSSSVMVNASTRFADGFEYGLGAEMGVSTDKLHVRGPVGLVGLTTQKYVVHGDGHIRA